MPKPRSSSAATRGSTDSTAIVATETRDALANALADSFTNGSMGEAIRGGSGSGDSRDSLSGDAPPPVPERRDSNVTKERFATLKKKKKGSSPLGSGNKSGKSSRSTSVGSASGLLDKRNSKGAGTHNSPRTTMDLLNAAGSAKGGAPIPARRGRRASSSTSGDADSYKQYNRYTTSLTGSGGSGNNLGYGDGSGKSLRDRSKSSPALPQPGMGPFTLAEPKFRDKDTAAKVTRYRPALFAPAKAERPKPSTMRVGAAWATDIGDSYRRQSNASKGAAVRVRARRTEAAESATARDSGTRYGYGGADRSSTGGGNTDSAVPADSQPARPDSPASDLSSGGEDGPTESVTLEPLEVS